MEYAAKIYSRIGELMQGVLPDASAFLVAGLPSRRWFSEAVLTTAGHAATGEDRGAATQGTPLPPKTRAALKALERQVGLRLPPEMGIELRSNIPWGKGLSSSSTDILSVLSVANVFFRTGLGPADLYRVAAQVEPTDPCLCDDIPVFYQHTGCRGATVDLPPVTLIYFDTAPGSSVDTVEMPRRRQETAGTGRFFSWLLRRLIAAAADADYEQLFNAITYSAEFNQQLLPLSGFAGLYKLAEESHAGVMVAHSGTIAGLLARPDDAGQLLPRVEALAQSRQMPGQPATPVYVEQYQSPYYNSLCTVFPAR